MTKRLDYMQYIQFHLRSMLMPRLMVSAIACVLWMPMAYAQHAHLDHRALHLDPTQSDDPIAPVLEGLGDVHFEVTTHSEDAQYFFNQGLRLTYGFNHQEALRAFKEASRLDPDLAMAYWGWALVLGQNINLPMREAVMTQAYQAIQQAMQLRQNATEKEQALIEALAQRYTEDPAKERAPYDMAYADAMRTVYASYPKDPDVATFFGAALMNLSPWGYWTRDGKPNTYTEEFLAAFESAMKINPQHTGALHYYIHAVEAVDPYRAEPAADALRGLAPGIGHLVHMPSHIYMQTGRYAESFEANLLAAKADEGYITQCRSQGIYPLNYYPHNVHFLAWASILQGREAEALAASRKVAANVPGDRHGDDWALYQTFLSLPILTMVRFGSWDDILNEPAPPAESHYWQGIWYYARGLALVHTNKISEAKEILATLAQFSEDPQLPEVFVGFSHAGRLLTIAQETLSGEIAAREKRYNDAVRHLDRAVRLEDGLMYNEPPDWFFPSRHILGAILLEANQPVEAEQVYWDSLDRYPDNGYALLGLSQSLEAQGRVDEAAEMYARYEKAWEAADAPLTTSRY